MTWKGVPFFTLSSHLIGYARGGRIIFGELLELGLRGFLLLPVFAFEPVHRGLDVGITAPGITGPLVLILLFSHRLAALEVFQGAAAAVSMLLLFLGHTSSEDSSE